MRIILLFVLTQGACVAAWVTPPLQAGGGVGSVGVDKRAVPAFQYQTPTSEQPVPIANGDATYEVWAGTNARDWQFKPQLKRWDVGAGYHYSYIRGHKLHSPYLQLELSPVNRTVKSGGHVKLDLRARTVFIVEPDSGVRYGGQLALSYGGGIKKGGSGAGVGSNAIMALGITPGNVSIGGYVEVAYTDFQRAPPGLSDYWAVLVGLTFTMPTTYGFGVAFD